MLTLKQIALVQSSFCKVLELNETVDVAELFYTRLFDIKPEYKQLFRHKTGYSKEQGIKLMKMLELIVCNLDMPETIKKHAVSLGSRHVNYKTPLEGYNFVGEALLWTLGQGLGEAFEGDLKEAWTQTYTALSSIMIEAQISTVDDEKKIQDNIAKLKLKTPYRSSKSSIASTDSGELLSSEPFEIGRDKLNDAEPSKELLQLGSLEKSMLEFFKDDSD